jgi:predicted Zn-dependent protease
LRRPLALSPDLALAHNLYTSIQVEQGQALGAMKRLLRRARTTRNDPELFAGLAHACRYCGLLEASLAAHQQARRLDSHIATSVLHTYFLAGDYQRALNASTEESVYFTALTLAMLGRVEEAISLLLLEEDQPKHLRLYGLFLTALRALLQGDHTESLNAADELLAATFRDPEGWYHFARQLSYLGESDRALMALSRSVEWGFFCFPAMVSDPWLDPLRGNPEFKRILGHAQTLHQEALSAFDEEGGGSLLGVLNKAARV